MAAAPTTHTLHPFDAGHDDIIHDVSFDYYGKRLATCSSDSTIKVWDRVGDGESGDGGLGSGQWRCSASWKAHAGSIWRVEWADPSFGQLFASCSFDRTVRVWEESPATGGVAGSSWTNKATLLDSQRSVQDVAFAPRHLGFKLATCSQDGFVRLYEAIDVTNLSHWPIMDEFQSDKKGLNCLVWNPSPFDPPMIVVGSNDSSVKVWEYLESQRRWQQSCVLRGHADAVHSVAWAPNLGKQTHLIATASKDHTIRIWELSIDKEQRKKVVAKEISVLKSHKSEVWRVQWNMTGTVLASSGDDGSLRFWKANFSGEWKELIQVTPARTENM
eukprot:TRINITY_DN2794_c0_g1_i1.p1 TRINITY_DN2794_c0_g1~~TRINITY_DN2794_c0_g1_i1.p1  ORF type:complete len:380 (+),score=87.72 TRINITY_DN2794_c0_g1_i1:152-1141(+)